IDYPHELFDPKTGLPAGEDNRATSTSAIVAKATVGSSRVIGIVSTSPWQSFGKGVIEVSQNPQPVALNGRVPVKVSLENGPIAVGDRITSSSVAGVGMRATAEGPTVGIALEPFDGSSATTTATLPDGTTVQTGKILVFVNLGWNHLDSQISGGSVSGVFWISNSAGVISTANILDLSGQGIINVNYITSANWRISEDGTLEAKKVVADDAEIKNGITTYDSATGEPYCIRITNGAVVSLAGKCSSLGATPPPYTPPSTEPPPIETASSTTPNTEPTASSTPAPRGRRAGRALP
ncbi:MAG: hypothetical protein AAB834_06505, partial [Patescibacteria group bacterium]